MKLTPSRNDNEELTALFEVSKVLTSSFDLEHNLGEAMRILSERLRMRRGTIALVDPDAREVRIAVAHGLRRGEMARGKYRVGEGVVGRVVETGRSMVVPDIDTEPLFLNRTGARIERDGIAFLCVPIKGPEGVLGVLSADRIFPDGTNLREDVRVLGIIASLIAQAIRLQRAYMSEKRQAEHLATELAGRYSLPNVVGDSDVMRDVLRVAVKVARSDATVLLRGESGTGKELIARAVHYESPRAKAPFVAVNCAALPENLLEAELFGYEKGAFTGAVASKQGRFELAEGGTIFLDEIGDVAPALQAKLLRVLQERTFERLGGTKTLKADVRVVSATNRDLEAMMKTGEFREDLYWRLNVVPIFLPALRQRAEDVPLLIEHFLGRFGTQVGRALALEPDALRALLAYPWPGNIREMENTIQRLAVLAEDDRIALADLPAHLRISHGDPSEVRDGLAGEVEEIERRRIVDALDASEWVQARAARLLGITPRQMGYKMRKYGLSTG